MDCSNHEIEHPLPSTDDIGECEYDMSNNLIPQTPIIETTFSKREKDEPMTSGIESMRLSPVEEGRELKGYYHNIFLDSSSSFVDGHVYIIVVISIKGANLL